MIYLKLFFILGSILILLSNCTALATVDTKYMFARRSNTIESYEQFISKYPDHPLSIEAKSKLNELREEMAFNEAEAENSVFSYKHVIDTYPNGFWAGLLRIHIDESETEWFIRTCKIGTARAFRGFLLSFPEFEYKLFVESRIMLINSVEKGTQDVIKRFITESPSNVFTVEAIANYPILWFAEAKQRLAITDIGIIESNEVSVAEDYGADIPESPVENIENIMKRNGFNVIRLDKNNIYQDKVPKIIIYVTKKVNKEHITEISRVSGFNRMGPVGLLAPGIIHSYSKTTIYYSITIRDKETGFEYYTDLSDLNAKAEKEQFINAMRLFGNSAIPSLIFAINDNKQHVRFRATTLLGYLDDPLAGKILKKFSRSTK